MKLIELLQHSAVNPISLFSMIEVIITGANRIIERTRHFSNYSLTYESQPQALLFHYRSGCGRIAIVLCLHNLRVLSPGLILSTL